LQSDFKKWPDERLIVVDVSFDLERAEHFEVFMPLEVTGRSPDVTGNVMCTMKWRMEDNKWIWCYLGLFLIPI